MVMLRFCRVCIRSIRSIFFDSFREVECYPKNKVHFYSTRGIITMVDKLYEQCSNSIVQPPHSVRGQTKLNKSAFSKNISVPYLEFNITSVKLEELRKILSKRLLKVENLKPLQTVENTENGDTKSLIRRFLLNPDSIRSFSDFSEAEKNELQKQNITEKDFGITDLQLTFDNWKAEVLLKSVLPLSLEPLTSYSVIGHIIHLNIREHLLPFKHVIGEVLLEKVKNVKTVVNKTDIIDNTYRNFKMEILCGEHNLITQLKENHCVFELDFSTVYWNPRLSTEHERIVSKLRGGDVLYDVFAGIGPFAIPAAKKKCFVMANDLNPEAHKWLIRNAELNKVSKNLRAFNKDGADFIKFDVKRDMLENWNSGNFVNRTMHITMNLPALAVEFVKYFKGLCNEEELVSNSTFIEPIVHVYCFCKGENTEAAVLQLLEENMGLKMSQHVVEISNIRNVSVNKDMMRVTFRLSKDILIINKDGSSHEDEEPCAKRQRAICHDGEG